ncbi:MAG: GFA family protein [Pseudomonadota bacterium]
MHEGGCLCGAVRYATKGPLRPVIACHCKQCRVATGNFVTATSCPRETLEIKGDVRWYASSSNAKRGFCAVCGSNLFWDGQGANVSIMAGSLDGETGLSLQAHIFCADKGDYYEISDGLPQSPGADPRFTTWVAQ